MDLCPIVTKLLVVHVREAATVGFCAMTIRTLRTNVNVVANQTTLTRNLIVVVLRMPAYKSSKYNYYLKTNEGLFIYNQTKRTFMAVDDELYVALLDNNIKDIPKQIIQQLLDDGYVCDFEFNEENVLLLENHLFRYSNSVARVTIMPTLNCNFSCWYCYENHHTGSIKTEMQDAIFLFCSNLIKSHKFTNFNLDWFGGEPMMYFRKAIVPLSSRLKKLCDSEHVTFTNTITTNGYLIKKNFIDDINDINLKTFQITLDGSKDFHNQTRFTNRDHNTYLKLTENIVLLCRNVDDIKMTLRINYTPYNINTIDLIADDFPTDVRDKIFVLPQLVWQFKNGINPQTGSIKDKIQIFKSKGFKVPEPSFCVNYCYAESMSQFVVNYDLNVYKCTARDFKVSNSVGHLTLDGNFIPNAHYYDYCVSSQMECKECLECHLLPSCLSSCIQKCIEGSHACYKEQIEEELNNKLMSLIK